MTRVLVIDNDEGMARALTINLRARRYDALSAGTGADGLVLAGRFRPECVVLDPDLPDMHGLEVVEGLRGWSSVPIIVTSHQVGEQAAVTALDAGSDDFIRKPFGTSEFFARLRALLRRSWRPEEFATVVTADFTLDLSTRRVTTIMGEVRLTPTEWRLVELLVRNPGKIVSRRTLLREVWGIEHEAETNYLRVYLAQIRRKLEPNPHEPRYFLTHHGMGVRFDDEPVPALVS